MSYSSVLQWGDGLGTGSILRGGRGSVVGLLATIGFLAVCLGVYVPAVMGFARGNFYQSEFESNARYIDRFYSGEDFKIAMVLRNRQTGLPVDHSYLLNLLEIMVVGSNVDGSYNEPLLPCDSDYFRGDLHAPVLTDCFVLPSSIEFTAGWEYFFSFGFLKLQIYPPVSNNPFQSSTATYSNAELSFISLLQDNYCDLYFTSKIVAPDGTQKFQVHTVSSSEFNIGSDYLIASFDISQQIRSTLIDDSILPWRNYRNVTNLAWLGETTFAYQSDATAAISSGYTNYITFRNKKEINLRYYKKLDWLIGIIGGGCFLLFLIFWAVFHHVNRAFLKMELARALLLEKIGSDYPQNDKDLKIPEVGYSYLLSASCCCCRKSHTE